MDATNDAIIGTACDYSWHELQSYAISLSRSGFRGRKILFVHNISSFAREVLLKLGFEVLDYTPKLKNVVVDRFRNLSGWLATQSNLRYVIHCDVRDVVVQSDPSIWFDTQTDGKKIWGTSEFIIYKDEACNPFWVEQLFGKAGLATLNQEDVVCAGTICGEADVVRRLTKRIFELSTDRFGDDQAALNVLLRTEFKDYMRIPGPEEGFALTAGWWLIGFFPDNADCAVGKRSKLVQTPPELRNGVAYPQGSTQPFCLVHQYDRGDRWIPAIARRYTPDFPVREGSQAQDTKVQVLVKEGVKNNARTRYAKDGLTIDWWDTHTKV